MTLELQTKSSLVDKIKEAWRLCKTLEFPIPGDYYYDSIDNGILYNKVIEIKSEHLPTDLKEYIQKEDIQTVKYVLQRAILEIFAEKFGGGLADRAKEDNRIKVKYD